MKTANIIVLEMLDCILAFTSLNMFIHKILIINSNRKLQIFIINTCNSI